MDWSITVESPNALDFRTHMAAAKDDKQSGIPGLDFDTRGQMDRLAEAAIALVSSGMAGGGPLTATISGEPGRQASVSVTTKVPAPAPPPSADDPFASVRAPAPEPATVSAGPTPPQD